MKTESLSMAQLFCPVKEKKVQGSVLIVITVLLLSITNCHLGWSVGRDTISFPLSQQRKSVCRDNK